MVPLVAVPLLLRSTAAFVVDVCSLIVLLIVEVVLWSSGGDFLDGRKKA